MYVFYIAQINIPCEYAFYLPIVLSEYLDWQKHKLLGNDEKNEKREVGGMGANKKCFVDDFILLKVLGKGSFGKVLLVRMKKDNSAVFAMKCLKKQRVFQRHQVEHTKTERRVLGYLCISNRL